MRESRNYNLTRNSQQHYQRRYYLEDEKKSNNCCCMPVMDCGDGHVYSMDEEDSYANIKSFLDDSFDDSKDTKEEGEEEEDGDDSYYLYESRISGEKRSTSRRRLEKIKGRSSKYSGSKKRHTTNNTRRNNNNQRGYDDDDDDDDSISDSDESDDDSFLLNNSKSSSTLEETESEQSSVFNMIDSESDSDVEPTEQRRKTSSKNSSSKLNSASSEKAVSPSVEIVLPEKQESSSSIIEKEAKPFRAVLDKASKYSAKKANAIKSTLRNMPSQASKLTSKLAEDIRSKNSAMQQRRRGKAAAATTEEEEIRRELGIISVPLNDTDEHAKVIRITAKIGGLKSVASVDSTVDGAETNKDVVTATADDDNVDNNVSDEQAPKARNRALVASIASTTKVLRLMKKKIAKIQLAKIPYLTHRKKKAIMPIAVDDSVAAGARKEDKGFDEKEEKTSTMITSDETRKKSEVTDNRSLLLEKIGEKGSLLSKRILVLLGGENSSSSETAAPSDEGIPSLMRFKVNENGSVSGYVKNQKNVPCVNKKCFKDGVKITTFPVEAIKKAGNVVTSKNGSKYRLAN